MNFRRPTKAFQDAIAEGGVGLRMVSMPSVSVLRVDCRSWSRATWWEASAFRACNPHRTPRSLGQESRRSERAERQDVTFDFLPETYATERLKTLSVWSQFRDDDLSLRPEPRARTPREHMVHQCVSEDTWMIRMLGINVGLPQLPVD